MRPGFNTPDAISAYYGAGPRRSVSGIGTARCPASRLLQRKGFAFWCCLQHTHIWRQMRESMAYLRWESPSCDPPHRSIHRQIAQNLLYERGNRRWNTLLPDA